MAIIDATVSVDCLCIRGQTRITAGTARMAIRFHSQGSSFTTLRQFVRGRPIDVLVELILQFATTIIRQCLEQLFHAAQSYATVGLPVEPQRELKSARVRKERRGHCPHQQAKGLPS